jgi:hypothetical protein
VWKETGNFGPKLGKALSRSRRRSSRIKGSRNRWSLLDATYSTHWCGV